MLNKRWRWGSALLTLAVLVGVIVLVDYITGTDAIGSTFRFALRTAGEWSRFVLLAITESYRFFMRGIEAAVLLLTKSGLSFVGMVARRRAWRFATLITPVGFGYFGNLLFTETRLRHVERFIFRYRDGVAASKQWWVGLSVFEKFLVVFIAISFQVALLPTISEYIIFFPYRFMVPVFRGVVRWFYTRLSDTFLGVLYWKYCGPTHRKVMRAIREFWMVKNVHDGICLLRLQYLTAWRLWKYDEAYRNEAGELWVSFIEPIRLWRRGTLNLYVGRPLLNGKYRAQYFLHTVVHAT